MPKFGILSTYAPTPCGLATFSAALVEAMLRKGGSATVVRIADAEVSSDVHVAAELVSGSPDSIAAAVDELNRADVALIQHEYGVYGGTDGDEILQIMAGLRVPSIVVAHTVLKDPTPHQRSVLESVLSLADKVVVMSKEARHRLTVGYAVDSTKIATIPHGAIVTGADTAPSPGRPTILTWGLLGPGKGIERVIDAMVSLRNLPNAPRYLVAGRTHPKVLVAQGEKYREERFAQAKSLGVSDSVSFDDAYRTPAELGALIQTAAVVVLPYDSRDQATSGVLVDSLATGRPVVATDFPHARELLGRDAIVDHDDPDALVHALSRVLTDRQAAGSMSSRARELAPSMAWPVVADAYVRLAQGLVVNERSFT
ncbi:glycosyltransferase [Mycolicibacterium arenosum]|uniref:Glycosyltransferase n=1 Tax=Mycolicibacterium arenosum TaxID=2952157 RepID=A0ABT1M490_9MYCO|nr:glycosyltransferase [Mycolicibacterium sp. CAU 1645]MCP9273984.1 glycosyltransferase [Mycolicibacterium sp. CAU 1645]